MFHVFENGLRKRTIKAFALNYLIRYLVINQYLL